jgi:hypothetical protein
VDYGAWLELAPVPRSKRGFALAPHTLDAIGLGSFNSCPSLSPVAGGQWTAAKVLFFFCLFGLCLFR